MAQAVEHLLSQCKAVSSNSNTATKKAERKKERQKERKKERKI
jgi:hypothetical protein